MLASVFMTMLAIHPASAPTTEYILVRKTIEDTEEGGAMHVWMWEDFGEDVEFRESVESQLSGYNEEIKSINQSINTLSNKVGAPKSDNEDTWFVLSPLSGKMYKPRQ